MFKNRLFKNVLFRWMPHKEQSICEKRLVNVIKRFKVDDFNFNWDRNSCYVEFTYQGEGYCLEHSVDKAREKGIILRNGLDCLNELTQSLEDLGMIIDRGMYDFDKWITGMKQSPSPSTKESPEVEEEFHIKYKSLGKQKTSGEETIALKPDPSFKNYEEDHPSVKRAQIK
ncbi:hypothetical protein SAMN05192559_10559 [Halobacillus karajensis]|uniref:Uncharacterized protein n=1 Tax=Halobacillus karajensis TaxID=195088 RepID=A0A024P684_9BACI|nr:hypothetical protein [Halobacillus karajensis]CDQ20668.1 hypothetical protein BN982_03021 [Halobacillus karajensis]CDQ23862.1 hypothetical protein BN983_02115 [Halobacillus karajensis]CDQ27340.1 hypothetical protein BN981_01596 [Halobacillus karajensis]SEH87733.1 hypothetical protein SAMN05192559_10559 [Halobacillus karajensis]